MRDTVRFVEDFLVCDLVCALVFRGTCDDVSSMACGMMKSAISVA